MIVRLLKPSELKSILTIAGNLQYKFKNFTGDGNVPATVLFEDEDNQHEIVGKVVSEYNWGEFHLWQTLQHENLVPLLRMMTFEDGITIFLRPWTGKSLHLAIEDESFVHHPKSFYRKKGYSKDVLLGLEYLHQNSVSLTNLTEANVLIDFTSDKAVISDLSCATDVRENRTVLTSTLVVDPVPPEACMADSIDSMPLDIWSCGVMFLKMFTRNVLPWCSLNVDLLDGLGIELLRSTNHSTCLQDDAAIALREFLKPFLEPEPEMRVNVSLAVTCPYLIDSWNRLDEPAREFWRAWDELQFDKESLYMGEGDVIKLPSANSKDIQGCKIFEEHKYSNLDCEKSVSETNNVNSVQKVSRQLNKTAQSSVGTSKMIHNNIESFPSNMVNLSESCARKTISNDLLMKLKKEYLPQQCNKDREHESKSFPKVQNKSTIQTISVPNLERTSVSTKALFPNIVNAGTTNLNIKEEPKFHQTNSVNVVEECHVSVPGSSSIEVIGNVNSEEFAQSLVLSSSDYGTRRLFCKTNEVPFSANLVKTTSEQQTPGKGGLFHNSNNVQNSNKIANAVIETFNGESGLKKRKDVILKNAFEKVWPDDYYNLPQHVPVIGITEKISTSPLCNLTKQSSDKTTNFNSKNTNKKVTESTSSVNKGSTAISASRPQSSSSIHKPCHSSWLTSAEEMAQNETGRASKKSNSCFNKKLNVKGPLNKKHSEISNKQLPETAAAQDDAVDISLDMPLFSEQWLNNEKWFKAKAQHNSRKKWLRVLCPGSKLLKKSKKKQNQQYETVTEK